MKERSMTVTLPPEDREFVEQLLGGGEYGTPADVISDGLDLLRAQLAYRRQRFARLKQLVGLGLEDMRQGRVTPFDPIAILEEVEQEFAESPRLDQTLRTPQ
jgi:Arc/MetJ-type ribon-helix-helix transcriptional regulator